MSDKYEYTLMELDHLQKELAEQGENRAVSFVALARSHIIEMDAEIETLVSALDCIACYLAIAMKEDDGKNGHYEYLHRIARETLKETEN